MAKSTIQNITVTQTFQNWFDKTNEMVDLFRDQVVTATATGDLTVGNVDLQGTLQANTVIADIELKFDSASAFTTGESITFGSPVVINGTSSKVVSTYNYASGGPVQRFSDGTVSWDVGFENSNDHNFIINTGLGATKLELSTAGTLTVPNLIVLENFDIAGDLTVADGSTLTLDSLVANTATITTAEIDSLQVNEMIANKFTGDIYHPAATGGNGEGKVLENGGPAANIPATFFGNVQGTVSSLTNHDTDSLKEGNDNLYFTTARVKGALTSGTGVGIIADPNNSAKTLISIGQSVNTNANAAFKTLTLNTGEADPSARDNKIYLNGTNGTIVAEGDITAFGTVSDINTKENIKSIENALDKISKLGGYTFNYKGKNERMTGVIAQELLEVLPEVVYTTKNPETEEETYAVRYGNIVGLLIEAIKELQEKIDKK